MPEETTLPEPIKSEPPQEAAESDSSALDRIVSDSKSLTEDVAEWIRLKVELIQIEVHQRVTEELNAILSSVIVLGLLVTAALLLMIAVAEYLATLLGNASYAYAIVAAFVAIVATVFGRIQPEWVADIFYILVPRKWMRGRQRKDDETRESEA